MSEVDIAALKSDPRDAETMLTPIVRSGNSARTQMVRSLVDIVVLPAGRISSNERSLVADILLHLVDKIEKPLRIEAAARVARVAECPPALLRMFLLDEPAVAQEILNVADTIPEALLIETAHNGGHPHRLLIAQHSELTTAIVDALLQYDEADVMKAILRRDDFTLSPNAVNKFVALSATMLDLHAALLRRPELEPAHGFMMFWWVDAERRKRILQRFALDRRIIQDALNDLYAKVFRNGGEDDDLVKEVLILAERRHRPRDADGAVADMELVLSTLTSARRYPSHEVVHAVSLLAGVSRDLASRILFDAGGEPFAVMCKALSIPRDQFHALLLTEGEKALSLDEADYLLAVFDTLARDFARAVMRYWNWEGNPRIAHITRLLGLDDELAVNSPAA